MTLPTRFGKYEVQESVGSGGFAEVFRCRDRALDTDVAIKVLHPHLARQDDVKERFVKEARILHQLYQAGYDRMVGVMYIDTLEDGRPFFVMPYLERGSLQDLIGSFEGPDTLSLHHLIGLGLELVEFLEILRDRELVHRDLKPDNVLIQDLPPTRLNTRRHRYDLPEDERLVLSDFGLSKILESSTTSLSQIAGTPWYVAPEQVVIDGSIDWRADQFSVGVVMFQLATGLVPWPERRWDSVRDVRLDLVDLTELRPDLPIALEQIIHRAVQPDPMDRYASPADISRELEQLVEPGETPDATAQSIEISVRSLLDAVESALPEASGRAVVEAARIPLDRPVSAAIVAADRTGEPGFAVRLAGGILDSRHSSLVGSTLTRIHASETPLLEGVLGGGTRASGVVEGVGERALRLRLHAPVYSVTELRLGLPGWALPEIELVDVPRALLHRSTDLAAQVLREADMIVLGLHGSTNEQQRLLETIQAHADSPQGGPIVIVGLGTAASPAEDIIEPLYTTIVREDVAGVRDVIEMVLADRISLIRAGRVVAALGASLQGYHSGHRAVAAIAEFERHVPELRPVAALRDVAAGRLTIDWPTQLEVMVTYFADDAALRLGLSPEVSDAPARARERIARLRHRRAELGDRDQRVIDVLITLYEQLTPGV